MAIRHAAGHLLQNRCAVPSPLQLRKLFRVLPAALARDQPHAVAEAAACFSRLPEWEITLLADLEPQARLFNLHNGGQLIYLGE